MHRLAECTDWLNAHDTAWRDGQEVYLCMAPDHSTALLHPLHQQSALGSGRGLEASQLGLAVAMVGLQIQEV